MSLLVFWGYLLQRSKGRSIVPEVPVVILRVSAPFCTDGLMWK